MQVLAVSGTSYYNTTNYSRTTMYWNNPATSNRWGGTNGSATNYSEASTDNTVYARVTSGGANDYPYWRFNFTIEEDIANIQWINTTFNGLKQPTEVATCWIYNYTAGNWITIGTLSNSDATVSNNFTTGFSNIINGGQLVMVCEGAMFDSGEYIDADYATAIVGWYINSAPYWLTDAGRNASTVDIGSGILMYSRWMDDVQLSKYRLGHNMTGTFCDSGFTNETDQNFLTANWTNTSRTVNNTCEGKVIGFRFFANDSANLWNNTSVTTFTVNGKAPRYYSFAGNNTSSTVNPLTVIKGSANWTDWNNMSAYTFELSNSSTCTATNYTQSFSPSQWWNWSNMTFTIPNSCAGSSFTWRIFANESASANLTNVTPTMTLTVNNSAPQFNNNNSNSTNPASGEPVLLYANWSDETQNLRDSWLETNETGIATNYSSYNQTDLTCDGVSCYAYTNITAGIVKPEYGGGYILASYTPLSSDDGIYVNNTSSASSNYVVHRFLFNVGSQDEIQYLSGNWNGNASCGAVCSDNTISLWVRNYSSGLYELQQSRAPKGTDTDLPISVTSNIHNYINGSNYVDIKVYSPVSMTANSWLASDYIYLRIYNTSYYNSPQWLSPATNAWTNYTWLNSSLTSGDVCWRIWMRDNNIAYNVTGEQCFTVGGAKTYTRYLNVNGEGYTNFSKKINITRRSNINSEGRMNFTKKFVLTDFYNINSEGWANFTRISRINRVFNINGEGILNFSRGINIFRKININSKGRMNFTRGIILTKIFQITSNSAISFLGTLVEGAKIYERFFNIASQGSAQFLKKVSVTSFFSIPSESIVQFSKSSVFNRLMNIVSNETIDFQGILVEAPEIFTRYLNIASNSTTQFSTSILLTRILDIPSESVITFEGIFEGFLKVFERFLNVNIESTVTFSRIPYIWYQPARFSYCILKNIGNVKICIFPS